MTRLSELAARLVEMQEEIFDLAYSEINEARPPFRPEDAQRALNEIDAAVTAAVIGDLDLFEEYMNYTSPDLCRALGHRTLENVLEDGI